MTKQNAKFLIVLLSFSFLLLGAPSNGAFARLGCPTACVPGAKDASGKCYNTEDLSQVKDCPSSKACTDLGSTYVVSSCYQIQSPLAVNTVTGLVCKVVDFLAAKLMPPIAVLMVLLASFLYLTAAGKPANVIVARQVLVFTVVGASVILLAPPLISLVVDTIFGGGSTGTAKSCPLQTATSSVIDALIAIVNWFSWLLAVLSVAVGLYAGYLYMTSSGEPQKRIVANRVLVYAIIGIFVAIIAFSVISLVKGLAGLP